jgi:hypothetical protein
MSPNANDIVGQCQSYDRLGEKKVKFFIGLIAEKSWLGFC